MSLLYTIYEFSTEKHCSSASSSPQDLRRVNQNKDDPPPDVYSSILEKGHSMCLSTVFERHAIPKSTQPELGSLTHRNESKYLLVYLVETLQKLKFKKENVLTSWEKFVKTNENKIAQLQDLTPVLREITTQSTRLYEACPLNN